MLTKEAILSVEDAQYKDVEIPQWGGTVRLRVMSGHQRDRYETHVSRLRDEDGTLRSTEGLRSTLIAFTAIDDNGDLLFSQEDVAILQTKSSTALDLLFEAARDLNGLGEDSVEEEEGNSEEGQTE